MLGLLSKLFGIKAKTDNAEKAPYKVEAPTTTVGTVPMTTQYVDGHGDVQEVSPKKKPAAKKPAGEKKPAVRAKSARTKSKKQ